MSLKRGISLRHKKMTETSSQIKRTNTNHDVLFASLFDLGNVRKLLRYDQCKVYTDNYSLAHVAVFLERLNDRQLYNERTLYQLLYIVGELNNDHELHTLIAQWALQENCNDASLYAKFLMGKDDLLEQLERMKPVRYIELVKIMERIPDHFIWSRKRDAIHSTMIDDLRN